jgi:predicted MFS family arabinose efflux permease
MERQHNNQTAATVLIGGMLGMVVAMGIARFAYTPILPLMQRDLGISNSLAGGLAAINYAGYLGGSLLCMLAPRLLNNRILTATALFISISTTLAMGLTTSEIAWSAMRFASGLTSAILFIVITAEVAETLIRYGHSQWLGALYSGIGLGIALSGLLVPWLDQFNGWSGTWIGMGGLALVIALLGLTVGRKHIEVRPAAQETSVAQEHKQSLWRLAMAYFLEGFGYIITATFIVAIITATPGLAGFAPYSWVAVGVAAIPSTLIWPLLARRFGHQKALLAAFALQAVGIVFSINATTIAQVLFAAVSFGATFLGIVALTLAEGNRRWPADSRRAAAILTTAFSLGQMFGPAVAGILADHRAGFALPLGIAAGCVTCGGVIILFDRFSPTTPY